MSNTIEQKDAEIARLKAILRAIHEALGEYPESDDASLPDVIRQILQDLRETTERVSVLHLAREYHEDMGSVLWWHLPVCEPPVVGLFEDHENSNGWLTHFSRMPIVWDGDGQALHLSDAARSSEVPHE